MLLIRLSGHSGAGKSRLLAALPRFNLPYRRTILYTSRPARNGEVHGKDYYFLTRGIIEQLPPDLFFIGPVRGMVQAVDLAQLEHDLKSSKMVIIEIFHSLWPDLKAAIKQRVKKDLIMASIFLTAIEPKSLRQVSHDTAANKIKNEVRRILEWRNKDPIDEIIKRSESAVGEILEAVKKKGNYDKIIYSAPEGPDGEDDWTKKRNPSGRAALAIRDFLSFIKDKILMYRASRYI